MASILVIAHPGGGTSGVLEQAAQLAGAALEEWSPAETTQPSAAIDDYDGLVVLGGGQNVAEQQRYPYLTGEIALIAAWHAGGRPLLGVCLGAQLLAAATGGTVTRLPVPQVGWWDLDRLPAGASDPLLGFGGALIRSYQWHSWAVGPPAGASVLARDAACVQAFRLGNSWGVQFHPEVTGAVVAEWIDDWRSDGDVVAAGFDPAEQRAQAERELPAWNAYGVELFGRFCALLG